MSTRRARASGLARSRSTNSARPTMIPHCGPPSSLSPLNSTRSAPARTLSPTIGSSGKPYCADRRGSRCPRRRSPAAAAPSPGQPARRCPPIRKSRRCDSCWDARAEWPRFLGRSRRRSRASRVRLVVPTSCSSTPAWRKTSGKRNEPPISMSWPREMITRRPAASVCSVSSVAAAQLLTTRAASAPVTSWHSASTAAPRRPRWPLSRSTSTLVHSAASRMASIAAGCERSAAEIRVNHDARAVDDLSQPLRCGAAGPLAALAAPPGPPAPRQSAARRSAGRCAGRREPGGPTSSPRPGRAAPSPRTTCGRLSTRSTAGSRRRFGRSSVVTSSPRQWVTTIAALPSGDRRHGP